jgi:hypothetical protein
VLRRRADPGYRRLWLGDWRVVLTANGAAAGESCELIVITAPGAGRLPWDRSQCTHTDGVTCSGKLGCVVEAGALERWNREAPANWTALNRAAASRTRRATGRFRMSFRVWEPQRRGALHMNVVVPATTPREKLSAALYRAALVELAPEYGFGFVDGTRAVRDALHAARYLAKYLSEGTAGKTGIGDLAARGDCPVVIARVSPELTRRTGITMRQRRQVRGLYLLAADLHCTVEEARAVRVKTGKLGRRRWSTHTTSGRSALPWDSQCQLAEWERTAQSAVAARFGDERTVTWPIPPRRPVSGVDFSW